VPELAVGAGAISGSFTAPAQAIYYKIVTSATDVTKIQLALLPPAAGSVQLFVGGGYVPTSQHYDYQQMEFDSTTASVVIPAGSAQTYYLTAYPQSLAATPTAYTLTATTVSFSLTSVSPSSAPARGSATLTFAGGGFTAHTAFRLVGSTGTVYGPTATYLFDSDTAVLTFDLTHIPAGSYTAEAIDGNTLTLSGAFTVQAISGSPGPLVSNIPGVEVSLETPTALRAGFPSIVTLNYRSTSNSDIPAPIMYISADNATLAEIQPQCDGCDPNLGLKLANTFNDGLVLGINRQGPAGVLPAGASGSIQFLATPGTSGGSVDFEAGATPLDPVASAYDASACNGGPGISVVLCNASTQTGAYLSGIQLCDSLAPVGIAKTGFYRACMKLLNDAGFRVTPFILISTGLPPSGTPPSDGFVGPYLSLAGWNKLLADDATALSASGTYEYDLQKILAFELEKDGMSEMSARFTVDGTAYTSAQSFTWTLGSIHAIATTSPQTSGGVQQTFAAWSDGGAPSHNVTAAAGTSAYTASFNSAYLLTLAASPSAGGSVTPATGTYYPAGSVVNLTATPAAGY
jgi:hypothetical protein